MIQQTTHIRIKALSLVLLCLIGLSATGKESLKSMSEYLDRVVNDKEVYHQQKEQEIQNLKRLLAKKGTSLTYEYEINLKLYDEYRKYKLDSAIHYVGRNVEIAQLLDDSGLQYRAEMQLASLYSFSGRPIESENILKAIPVHELPRELLPEYYETQMDFFRHYATSSNLPSYALQAIAYRDSFLSVAEPTSFKYKLNRTLEYMREGANGKAEEMLNGMMETEGLETPEYAYVTYYLGDIYKLKGDIDRAKIYYMKSVVADVKNALKENGAFQRLALVYYEDENIAKAFKYTQLAIEDAVSSGVQFRTMQMSLFYSIVNASYQAQEAKTNAQLRSYLLMISILSIFLLLLMVYIYKQMRKLARIKEELSQSNDKLVELNTILNGTNSQLNEKNRLLWSSSHMREQYIANFFNLCSTYIDTMEDYRKTLYRLGINKQYEELIKKLKSTALAEKELEILYTHFDSIFLNLYPTFITDFNALLSEDEQITPKSGELLNKELRIYALLRLGITDSVKIAAFLRCSMSTIYNYRTKMRNKAAAHREEFEDMVMQIGEMNHSNTSTLLEPQK